MFDLFTSYEQRLSSLRIKNDIRINSILGINEIHIDMLSLLLQRICNETLYLTEDLDNENENENLLYNIRRYIATRQDLKRCDIDTISLINISQDMLKRYEQSKNIQFNDDNKQLTIISSKDPLNNDENNIILSSELFVKNLTIFHSISLKRKLDNQIDSCIELFENVKIKRNKIYHENNKLNNGISSLSLPLLNTDLEIIYTDQLLGKLQNQLQSLLELKIRDKNIL